MKGRKFLIILKDYGDHSSICGFRYLSQDGRTIIERLFWIVAIAGCCFATYLLTKSSFYAYKHHPVSFATETDYLHWNTTFPQINVCEVEVMKSIPTSADYIYKNYPGREQDWNLMGLIHNTVFTFSCAECVGYCKNNPICKMNFREVARKVRAQCEDLLKDCRWNGEPFDCCSKFLLNENERGFCYAVIPSLSTSIPPLMVANKDTGPTELEFKVLKTSQVYLLGPDDTPQYNTEFNHYAIIRKNTICTMIFSAKEIQNDPNLKYEDLERRKCRYPHETVSKRFDRYSKSTCLVECRAKYELKLCNCTHHYVPRSENTMCDSDGLACLGANANTLQAFRARGEKSEKQGIECDCPPSCVEPEYNIVYNVCRKEKLSGYVGSAHIRMAGLPTERLKRNLIRSKLDLVVSIGGTAGLFLGASLLSAAEILIIFCIRPFSARFKSK